MLSIGDLSDRTGISTQTIRYYERIRLLPEPKRANNGYRIYDEMDVERLQFIQRARALDFSLDDVGEILAFRERNQPPCQYVMNTMKEQISEIQAHIHNLEKLRDELVRLYEAGKQLPEDVQMRTCVCHLIKVGTSEKR
ncbi:MAG: heavy metal-responsive transcriptional regulator [Anaerolineae bacterium]|nr:heavy metal-responsive transcriptional regulator [Anaerolineae bacterium]